jgi:Na+/phosphate symporter
LTPNKEDELTLLWIVLVVLYIALWVTLGMTTLRKGHTALFWFGIIFPVLWIVGAIMQPTPQVAAAQARASLE